MSEVNFVRGQMLTFKSNKSFGLNFEDKTPSVKVLEGDTISYDGEVAFFRTKKGDEIQGRTPWLRGAIRMDWLTLVPGKSKKFKNQSETAPEIERSIQNRRKLYDNLKGGDFDEYVRKNNNIKKYKVESQENRVIKNFDNKPKQEKAQEGKHEVAGDQVAVKSQDDNGSFVVNSSTVQPKSKKHSTAISSSEDYGAEKTMSFKDSEGNSQKQASTKKKRQSYTVDSTTPKLQEGATKNEISRAKGVISAEEAQNATVVKKIKRGSMNVEETDGITLKNQVGSGDLPISTKASVSNPNKKEINTKAKVSKTSESVTDISSQGTVVSKQKTKKTGSLEHKTASNEKKAENMSNEDSTQNYLDAMPDDWADLHWTKKEKFIKQQTDKGLLEFIMRVENVKVIQNACKKRLKELD